MTAPIRPALLGTATASALLLAACGGGSTAGTSATAGASTPADAAAAASAEVATSAEVEPSDDALAVVAAFYPLEFLASEVGGERVEVTGLTPPGAEAHDLELSPQSLASLDEADLVVVLSDFQPALDDALLGAGTPTVDLAPVADRPYGEDAGEHTHGDDTHADDEHVDEHVDEHADTHADDEHAAEHADDEHADEHAEVGHGHADGDTDPHFWLDPTHMATAAEAVAAALAEVDPDGTEEYQANAAALVAELTELDETAQEALGSCEVDTLVTAHDAFGYFADRYGFEVRSINGLTPDQEPDARTLAEISDFVADSAVSTVYTETLVSSAVADTVAAEAGVRTAVLDPLEGLTDDSAGADYGEVMRSNIDTVRAGQACA